MTMYGMLSDLLESGVPLLRAIEILAEQTTHKGLQEVIVDLASRVADGASFADACRKHPEVFSSLAVSIIHAGEEGGFLDDSLSRLAQFTERSEELRGKVLGALAYPAFLLVTGIAVLVGMMMFFVPKFAPMFDRLLSQGRLPLPTRILLSASETLAAHAVWFVLLLALLLAALWTARNSTAGQEWWDRFRLNCPGIGPVTRSLAMSRFCRLLGTLLQNGVGILKALSIAKDATGNRVIRQAIASAASNVSSGKSLTEPLRASGQFPLEILELVSVGEQTNRLDQSLLAIADKWEQRTQRRLDAATKMIEPVLMLVMAVLVGFMVIALLLPVFENTGGIG